MTRVVFPTGLFLIAQTCHNTRYLLMAKHSREESNALLVYKQQLLLPRSSMDGCLFLPFLTQLSDRESFKEKALMRAIFSTVQIAVLFILWVLVVVCTYIRVRTSFGLPRI